MHRKLELVPLLTPKDPKYYLYSRSNKISSNSPAKKSYKSLASLWVLGWEIDVKTTSIHVFRYGLIIYYTYMVQGTQNKK